MSLKVSLVKIHKLADVQSDKIGLGTTVWQFCVILPGATIGENCNINAMVLIEGDVVIGNNVTVKSGVQLWGGLRIGDNVFIGPNVTFTNDRLPRSKVRPDKFLQIHIEPHASIGANTTVLGGVVIGRYAMIGAGSVVTKSVPNYGMVFGEPAQFKGYVCSCGVRLPESLLCSQCHSIYQKCNEGIKPQKGTHKQ